MLKIRINDKVLISKGKDKGKTGIVSKIIKKINKKGPIKIYYILEGLNVLKKHVKPMPNKNKPGGINKIEAPISASNVFFLNPFTLKKDKVCFKLLDTGKKIRILKSSGEVLN